AEPPGRVREEEHPRGEEGGDEDRALGGDALRLDEEERQEEDDRGLEIAVREGREAGRLDPREDAPAVRRRWHARRLAGGARIGLEARGGDDRREDGEDARGHERALDRRREDHELGGERTDDVADRDRDRVEARDERLLAGRRAHEEDRLAADP